MNNHGLRIAFTGQAEHGKSTSAAHLLSKAGGTEMMFAKIIKDIVAEILQFTEEEKQYMYVPHLKKQIIPAYNTSARRLLQVIGTELFREKLSEEIPELKLKDKSIWIHHIDKKLEQIDSKNNVVISDCRFDDEYAFLKSRGFTVIKIRDPRKEIASSADATLHKSEQGCPFDLEIINDGTLQDLYTKLDQLFA